ncbi:MAG: hypothetical protein ACRC24_03680 [Vibrionaceae bacterium]
MPMPKQIKLAIQHLTMSNLADQTVQVCLENIVLAMIFSNEDIEQQC